MIVFIYKWPKNAVFWGWLSDARDDPLSAYLNISTLLYEVVSTVVGGRFPFACTWTLRFPRQSSGHHFNREKHGNSALNSRVSGGSGCDCGQAYGGNVLINVGPTADGRIATLFQERLLQIGGWLKVNGEAIYGSRMWREHNDTASHGMERGVYYTASSSTSGNLSNQSQSQTEGAAGGAAAPAAVYAIAMSWPVGNELTLHVPRTSTKTSIELLGCARNISWRPLLLAAAASVPTTDSAEPLGAGLVLTLPPLTPSELPTPSGPWVFKLTDVS